MKMIEGRFIYDNSNLPLEDRIRDAVKTYMLYSKQYPNLVLLNPITKNRPNFDIEIDGHSIKVEGSLMVTKHIIYVGMGEDDG